MKRAVEKTQPWTRARVIYLAGKAGSAVYGLTQISRIEQVRERLLKTGEEIEEIAELEIRIREEQFLVSDAKASWTQILLEAQSIVEFAKSA